jgi:Ca2+-binding RTX toxin-like protein
VIINLTFDPSVANAPAGFTAALAQVVTFFENNFSNPVTVNIQVGYGEVQGQALPSGALGESLSFLQPTTYAALTGALSANASSAADASAVASLPATDPTGGAYWLTQAEAKALGLSNSPALDGFVGFSSKSGVFDFQESDLITAGKFDFFAVAVHEISEILGRQLLVGQTVAGQPNSYEALDLFHFSASGVRIFTGTAAGYFSADNGATNLASFNTNAAGDFGDWAASAGNDAGLAFSSPGVINVVSGADMTEMDVLGWTVIPRPDLTVTGATLSTTAVSFTVHNTGVVSAGASTAAVYLSTDASITNADIQLGTSATPSLDTLASDLESVALNFPTDLTPGTYYIGVIADDGGEVTEFNENNNLSNPAMPVILGNSAANTLTGTSAANLMFGLGGDDSLVGGAGADTMVGGTGDDTYSVDNSADQVIENPGEGADLVLSSVTYTLGANVENLTLTGSAAINGTGNALANAITGNTGNNTLAGLGGADTLDGGGGTDTVTYAASGSAVNVSLAAGTASRGDAEGDVLSNIENLTGSVFNDTLEGDAGNNVLIGGSGVDTLSYAHATAAVNVSLALTTAQTTGGAGTDTVSQFENLTGSAFADTLTGSTGNNVLSGGGGDDSLTGGAGADTLVGGAGDDTLAGGTSGDHFVFDSSAGGVDTIADFNTVEHDRIDLTLIDANTTLAGDQAFVFIGAQAFHNVAGELRFVVLSGGGVTVMGDTNGDGIADFTLNVSNVASLASTDFLL